MRSYEIKPAGESGRWLLYVRDGAGDVVDICDAPTRFTVTRLLNFLEPGTPLALRKVRKR